MQANSIVGIFGKKGSGKSYFMLDSIKKMSRYIVLDPLHEYPGVIFYNWYEVIIYLDEMRNLDFKIVYRPVSDEDVYFFLDAINLIKDFTFIVEEIDFFCDRTSLDPEIMKLTKYGRHFKRNFIWISRSPYEVSRFLTRQCDMLITFNQTEPRDIEYLKEYPFKKDVTTLGKYEYTWCGDKNVIRNFLHKSPLI